MNSIENPNQSSAFSAIPTRANTWATFHEKINKILYRYEDEILAFISVVGVRDDSIQLLIANGISSDTTSEKQILQSFHPMVSFRNYILEDVSKIIGDFSNLSSELGADFVAEHNGRRFHNLYFPEDRKKVSNKRDLILRFKTNLEKEVLSSPDSTSNTSCVLPSPLPSWRVMPWWVVSFFEIRSPGADLLDTYDLQRVLENAESLLGVVTGRKVVFSVVTNMTQCVFTATVTQSSHGEAVYYQHFVSGLITKNVVHELASFMSMTPASLGANFHFPVCEYEPINALSRGSTGCVISGNFVARNIELVMKISVNSDALEIERIMLGYLHTQGDAQLQSRISRVHSEAQAALQGAMKNGCSVFDAQYSKIDCTKKAFTKDRVLELWEVLCVLHRLGVVHRDIRPPNCMLSSSSGGSGGSGGVSGLATDDARSEQGESSRKRARTENQPQHLVLIDFGSAMFFDRERALGYFGRGDPLDTCTGSEAEEDAVAEAVTVAEAEDEEAEYQRIQSLYQPPAWSSASEAVLEELEELRGNTGWSRRGSRKREEGRVRCSPADEACSVVLCALQARFPSVRALTAAQGTPLDTLEMRCDYLIALKKKNPEVGVLLAQLDLLKQIRFTSTESERTAAVRTALDAVFALPDSDMPISCDVYILCA